MSESPPPSDAHQLVLKTELIIGNASALQDVLIDAASGGGAVTIDAGSVVQVHTPALQLLLAFTRQAEEWGITVEWDGVSQEMHDVADLAGLTEAFGIPSTRPTPLQD
jgi:ABC-type transporter Mla MlaB component